MPYRDIVKVYVYSTSVKTFNIFNDAIFMCMDIELEIDTQISLKIFILSIWRHDRKRPKKVL